MAQQHFYARVPSRLSMFNKADGYDTFACSEKITRDFSEKELTSICDWKITPAENEIIRDGKASPVYTQFLCKSGELVQSCICFLPKDYTGERTAYQLHSLVFQEDECKDALNQNDRAVLNPQFFKTDFDFVNFSDPEAAPDHEFPELDFHGAAAEDPIWLRTTYDADTVRRFLYAVLASLCGKIKCVYIALPDSSQEQTDYMVRLINAVLSVLPYYLRRQFSFATRVNALNQLNFIRFKGFVTPEALEVQAPKCAVVDLANRHVTGLNDKDIAENMATVELFYSFLKHRDIRDEYLAFCDRAVSVNPDLGACNLKSLGDLAFMFRSGCDLYDKKVVLPNDDKVLDMLTLYEDARNAFTDEYRIKMFGVFTRYSEAGKEIPKKIFAKVTKLYPSEIVGTRHAFMNVALDLIHTDAMKEKLFTFIKSSYSSEDEETKASILHHLCGVFYGGFLQGPILAFFMRCYSGCSADSQVEILDRVLLAIRTKALRLQIIEFFETCYEDFDDILRKKIFETAFAQLREGDELAESLISFIDTHIEGEPKEFRFACLDKMLADVEAEQRRSEHPMLPLFRNPTGLCATTVVKKIFTEWKNRKIFGEYISLMLSGNFASRMSAVRTLGEQQIVWDDDLKAQFTKTLIQKFDQTTGGATLDQLMNEVCAIREEKNDLLCILPDTVLNPMIASLLTDVFTKRTDSVTVEELTEYGQEIPCIRDHNDFGILLNYLSFKSAFRERDLQSMILLCGLLPTAKNLREKIAAYMERDLLADPLPENLDIEMKLLHRYVQSGNFGMEEVYHDCMKDYIEKNGIKKLSSVAQIEDAGILARILTFGCSVDSMEDSSEDMKAALISDASGASRILSEAAQTGKSKLQKYVAELTSQFSKTPFVQLCRKPIATAKKPITLSVPSIDQIKSSVKKTADRLLSVFKKH